MVVHMSNQRGPTKKKPKKKNLANIEGPLGMSYTNFAQAQEKKESPAQSPNLLEDIVKSNFEFFLP